MLLSHFYIEIWLKGLKQFFPNLMVMIQKKWEYKSVLSDWKLQAMDDMGQWIAYIQISLYFVRIED